MPRKPRLICVQTVYDHWSAHSGYHQYLKHLGDDFKIEHVRVENGSPDSFRSEREQRFCERCYDRRMTVQATMNNIVAEVELFRRILKHFFWGGRLIVHFLDGEYGYNWFGRMRARIPFAGDLISLAASYHQPPGQLASVMRFPERLRDLDMIFTVGSSQADYFDYGIRPRVRLVPHGVDTDFFTPGARRLDGDEFVCVIVGFWLRDVAALNKVVHASPEYMRFRVVANARHLGELEPHPRLEVLSGISDDELLAVYRNADAGIMPLVDTTANNAVLEMMACGLPIVTTDVGSIRDYVSDDSAVIVERNDAGLLLDALVRLRNDSGMRYRMSESVRRRACELGWARVALRMREAYEVMLRSKRTGKG